MTILELYQCLIPAIYCFAGLLGFGFGLLFWFYFFRGLA